MRCPVCKQELVPGGLCPRGLRCYTTLEEYVSDPNQEPSPRPVWVCPSGCQGEEKGCFSEEGNYYAAHYRGPINEARNYALDSLARKWRIIWLLYDAKQSYPRSKYLDELDQLRVDGEDDIPPRPAIIFWAESALFLPLRIF